MGALRLTTPDELVRPVAVITGVSRSRGIAAVVSSKLASSGWDIVMTGWPPHDETVPWGNGKQTGDELVCAAAETGARAAYLPKDLSEPRAAAEVFDFANERVGAVTALVVIHNYEKEGHGGLLETTPEEFDRSMAVNARATMLLAAEFARRFAGPAGRGRVVTFTSGLPLKGAIAYAASKGAIEWITVSAAAELAPLGITANAVNPGPNDTGWMDDELYNWHARQSPLGRVGTPADTANLVAFLCSENSGWITGQVLASDGGWSALRV
jgi:3-oxoacyl-[acyl-carrier protein] reductase